MEKTRFEELKKEWVDATGFLSNMNAINQHPAVNEFIAAGIEILPWIIEDMRTPECFTFWYYVLCQITHCDPVPFHHLQHIQIINEDWIQWYDSIYTHDVDFLREGELIERMPEEEMDLEEKNEEGTTGV
jgi:hypothetical protein